LTTLAYRFGGRSVFALEGSVFVAGAAVQWLRDGLRLFSMAAETQELAAKREDNRGVYFVPAFTGLGAPYWDAEARGAIFGLTRDTGAAELVRAALEAVAYQTHDLIAAMTEDTAQPLARLRIDGGMARNDWLCQFLADILNVPLERPSFTETTAWGAAICAGIGAGLLGTPEEIGRGWQADRNFTPKLGEADRDGLLAGWHDAVERVRGHHSRG
jgi:glycerol kinase